MGATIVEQATRTARAVILASFAATAALVGVLVGERLSFQASYRDAAGRARLAGELAGRVLLADERLTMSATMAAATGEERWVERYEADIPAIDGAIRGALAIAPPAVAARFDAETRAANDRLVELERAAFAEVREGRLEAARRTLDGPAYAEQKAVLARGTERFMASLSAAVGADLARVERRGFVLLGALVAVAAAGYALLWRRLVRASDERIDALASRDTLTGLPNRRHLDELLERALARAGRKGTRLAALMINLDRFKPVNDRFGHPTGDRVLVEVAGRLAAAVRADEAVARVGGDEFVLLVEHGAGGEDAPIAAGRRLVAALSAPMRLGELDVQVGASVGVATYPTDATTAADLIRKADIALHRAKGDGRGEVRSFEPAMDAELQRRATLEAELRRAIGAGEIVPYFQPLVDLAARRIAGFEVLARWRHRERGVLEPAVFLPLAEQIGLISDLTFAVLRAACREAGPWPGGPSIAVNLSPRQLDDPDLVDRVLAILAEAGFPARRLEIEITEAALAADLDAARRTIAAFKERGIAIALDDFGTGYSSLAQLSELPFDRIKIDRSFVRTLGQRQRSAAVVSAIVGLGRSLGLATTAEGIETPADAERLRALGCDLGQGYHYARPVPAEEAARMLANDAAIRAA